MAEIRIRKFGVSALGLSVVGFVILLAIIAVPVLLLLGAAEFSVWALGWIPDLIGGAALVSLALVPLAFIPATRGLASGLFGFASLSASAARDFLRKRTQENPSEAIIDQPSDDHC